MVGGEADPWSRTGFTPGQGLSSQFLQSAPVLPPVLALPQNGCKGVGMAGRLSTSG